MPSRVASYGFYQNQADNFIGPIDFSGDKLYRVDWGTPIPVVKGRCGIPSFLTDNEMVDVLQKLGAQIFSIDQRNATENNTLETDVDQNVQDKSIPSTYKPKYWEPRKLVFTMTNGESIRLIAPRREGCAAIAKAIAQDLVFKSGMQVVNIELIGEHWLDALAIWRKTLGTKQPSLSVGERWSGLRDDDPNVKNAQYTWTYNYAADLADSGTPGDIILLRGKVASMTDSNNRVIRPPIVDNNDWRRMTKPVEEDFLEVARKSCRQVADLTPRHLIADFAVGDEDETIIENNTGKKRFISASMMIPLADYKSAFFAGITPPGTPTLGGAISQFVNSNKHMVCAEYRGESNRRFGEWLRLAPLESLVNFLT
ncbi:hypothetical protein [Picosynechococcus sp. PCC 8807]|uniref:hypothetical protein n=1 Tax=Picosynechococcus sp. PCC 8807 TaxID=195248 RepID=UPI000810736C|nr:hypothetical protein [Picosynechococcus sp. PCC 8807]ANV92033.1 hypothetical protein AWQ24_14735 [Picosynechococcus sp. PCC 8807]